jgi:hypothetical protein
MLPAAQNQAEEILAAYLAALENDLETIKPRIV